MHDVQIATLALTAPRPDELVAMAVSAARGGTPSLRAALDSLPVPIYVTDGEGWVRFFNRACIDFAGRTPVPGEDRWCVTWRLFSDDGEPLPHDRCPMAVAIQEARPIRGVVAAAERPDGTRVMFVPYPTPILDAEGRLTGAVNILIDVTDRRQAEALRAQAERCRRLARSVTDERTIGTLKQMATEYDDKARGLDVTA